MPVTRRLRIRGLVQGVGYRDALRGAALARNCTGWVRNRSDGSVEALVQGEPADVQSVVAWARCGPPAARVAAVDAADEPHPPLAGFDRLPTA